MEEVVIKAEAVRTGNVNKKIREHIFYYIVKPGNNVQRTSFLSTMFPPVDTVAIKLQDVELTLSNYDTSLISVYFVLFQVCGTDTTLSLTKLDDQVFKRRKVLVNLQNKNIILCPGKFYMGYGYEAKKNLNGDYKYKLYCSDKGISAYLSLLDSIITVNEVKGAPFVFPFKLSYKVY